MPEPFVVQPRDGVRATRVATPTSASFSSSGAETRSRFVPSASAADAAPVAAGERIASPRARVVPDHPALDTLAPFLADPAVTDLFVNGSDGLFVDRGRGAERASGWRATEEDVRALAVALIGLGGRHLDDASACVDVRLEGGIRVHAVLPPVAPSGTAISIRVPQPGVPTLDELEASGMFDAHTRSRLESAVERRENLLVTGAAGAGKTTLLAALLGHAARTDRIVTIEDVAELRIAHPHHVRLEARQPNLEGAGGIGLARLVREALRMRPDRLVVGECRGEEVRELLSALNTGHDGGAGTLHANGLHEVAARLESLGALAGLDDRALARQVVSAIGVVLHVARDADGARRLAAIGHPALDAAGRLTIEQDV
ncbi:TadA family conjugal transfer-associated ATPase [Microbacterium sp. SS28]|uniref:TadA family conjugal transfer-associated ATPase n=1 Tax=Microbacterium sp. SS28 TaxID=2919948 RepID=UPI001FAB32F2|nr:TadA family conjugal transfer-associated ATPase [Microbacterium sp. SS28]